MVLISLRKKIYFLYGFNFFKKNILFYFSFLYVLISLRKNPFFYMVSISLRRKFIFLYGF